MEGVRGKEVFDAGKRIRLERIMDRETKKTVIVPMNHGVTSGPIPGLRDMSGAVNKVAEGGANAVLLHKGIVRAGYRGYGRDIGLIIHLSGSTLLGPDPNKKVQVTNVEEAIALGADAVSVHVNIGSSNEHEQLQALGNIAEVTASWGVPLVAMMYPRGENIEDEHDPDLVAHSARVGAELGADIIKTNYTGSAKSFRKVVSGCPVPVVIAGGPKLETDLDILKMVERAIRSGGAGVSIGRNVFQHKNPVEMVRALAKIVHEGARADEVAKKIQRR